MVQETRLRVRYSETDAMGVVYHGNYLVWFEMGRTEWCAPMVKPTGSWRRKA